MTFTPLSVCFEFEGRCVNDLQLVLSIYFSTFFFYILEFFFWMALSRIFSPAKVKSWNSIFSFFIVGSHGNENKKAIFSSLPYSAHPCLQFMKRLWCTTLREAGASRHHRDQLSVPPPVPETPWISRHNNTARFKGIGRPLHLNTWVSETRIVAC